MVWFTLYHPLENHTTQQIIINSMGARQGQRGRAKDPYVLIERDPIIESRIQQGENVVRKNATCFLCGASQQTNSERQTLIHQRRYYMEQTSLFKGLLMTAQVRRRMSPKAFNLFSENVGSCAGCVGMIKEVWDLTQEINHIQKELDKVLIKARERLTLKYDIPPDDQSLGGRTRKISSPGNTNKPPKTSDNNNTSMPLGVMKEGVGVSSSGDEDSDINKMPPYHYIDIDMDESDETEALEDIKCGLPSSRITTPIRRSKRKAFKMSESLPTKVRLEGVEDEDGNTDDAYKENIEDSDSDYDETQPKRNKKVRKRCDANERRKFQCSKCGKTLSKLQKLVSHEIRVCKIQHDKNELERLNIRFYDCDQCDRRFVCKSDLNRHTLSHTERIMSSCPKCGKSSSRRYEVNQPCQKCKVVDKMDSSVIDTNSCVEDNEIPKTGSSVEENDGPPKPSSTKGQSCSKCGKVLSNFHKRMAHEITICKVKYDDDELKRINIRFHKCGLCERKFFFASALAKHTPTHSAPRPFPCDNCEKSFRQPSYLKRHQQLWCRGTNDDQKSKSRLQEQAIAHSANCTFKCSKCPQKFINKSMLIAHLAHHQQLGDTTTVCDICGKLIPTTFGRSALQKHIRRVHSKELRFHCSYCDKGFFYASDHIRHVKGVHENDESSRVQYACEKCGKMVTNMDRHNRNVHEKIRRFECQICHYKFLEKDSLNKHEKTHNKTDYSCPKCGRVYKSLKHFESHQKRMPNCDKVKIRIQKRNLELINCLHCQEVLEGKWKLRMHMKQIHPEHVEDLIQNDVDNSQLDDPGLVQNESSSDLNQNVEGLDIQLDY